MKQVILEYGGAVIAILGAISFFLIFNHFFVGREGVFGQMLSYSIGEKSLSDNIAFDAYHGDVLPKIVAKEDCLIVVNQRVFLSDCFEARAMSGEILPVYMSRAWKSNGEETSLGVSKDGDSICVPEAGIYRVELYAVDENGKKASQTSNLLVNER